VVKVVPERGSVVVSRAISVLIVGKLLSNVVSSVLRDVVGMPLSATVTVTVIVTVVGPEASVDIETTDEVFVGKSSVMVEVTVSVDVSVEEKFM
jgi:hypothetical protein